MSFKRRALLERRQATFVEAEKLLGVDTGKYMLGADGRTPVHTTNLLEWAFWVEANPTVVAFDRVGPLQVSTVFLALDFGRGVGRPLLFETAIFDERCGEEDLGRFSMEGRDSTWVEAERRHAAVLKRLREEAGDDLVRAG